MPAFLGQCIVRVKQHEIGHLHPTRSNHELHVNLTWLKAARVRPGEGRVMFLQRLNNIDTSPLLISAAITQVEEDIVLARRHQLPYHFIRIALHHLNVGKTILFLARLYVVLRGAPEVVDTSRR